MRIRLLLLAARFVDFANGRHRHPLTLAELLATGGREEAMKRPPDRPA